jgi:arsenate reductase (thioredoxin)
VLFLCTGNSCRSRIAEAWARHLKADVVEPYSAGTHPRGLDPFEVKAMAEVGLDIAAQPSKAIADIEPIPFDYVVTVCSDAHETCPVFPSRAKVVHAGFDDPPRLAADARSEAEALTTTGAFVTRSTPLSSSFQTDSQPQRGETYEPPRD